MNKNEWNVSNFFWEQHKGNKIESFYDNITIRPLFFFLNVENIGIFLEF